MSGRLIVVSGPSGSGKSTIVSALLDRIDIDYSVSATTRPPRPGEEDGRHYQFVTVDQFERMIDDGELLEWARYNDNYYGTPRRPIEQAISEGRRILLEIEIQGARQVKESMPDSLMFFLVPPSIEELERRLRTRGDTSDEAIRRRLAIARIEMEEAADLYDYLIVNDEVERATQEIANRIVASDGVA